MNIIVCDKCGKELSDEALIEARIHSDGYPRSGLIIIHFCDECGVEMKSLLLKSARYERHEWNSNGLFGWMKQEETAK